MDKMEKKVLIIDDCDMTRRLLSYIVRANGYKIMSATNGFEALEIMASNQIDLVITDLNMPQMDGLELTRNLRAGEAYHEIPIIMVTTEGGDDNIKTGMTAGVSAYLVKPFSAQKLLYEMSKLI
ncbi:MAG: response regulator [Deltaproteobacteria bacterium]|nr:response regulator [Deltaproteobacteria bacterium]